jgi:hypothetical protein
LRALFHPPIFSVSKNLLQPVTRERVRFAAVLQILATRWRRWGGGKHQCSAGHRGGTYWTHMMPLTDT